MRLLREKWEDSSDAGDEEILGFLEAYELDLAALEIDTSSMM